MRVTYKQMVLDAIIDLSNQEQVATRTILAETIDLTLSIIDEKLQSLANDGLIYRVQKGVYAPVIKHNVARIISKTVLPCGLVKVDIGDDVWTLTPKEARLIGNYFMSDAMQYSNIESGHHAAMATGRIERELKDMRRENRELRMLLEKKPFELV